MSELNGYACPQTITNDQECPTCFEPLHLIMVYEQTAHTHQVLNLVLNIAIGCKCAAKCKRVIWQHRAIQATELGCEPGSRNSGNVGERKRCERSSCNEHSLLLCALHQCQRQVFSLNRKYI